MKTLITLIIGIIIGAAGLFYGVQNGMVTIAPADMGSETETTATEPQASAAPAAKPAATPAAKSAPIKAKAAEPASLQVSESDESDDFEDDAFSDD